MNLTKVQREDRGTWRPYGGVPRGRKRVRREKEREREGITTVAKIINIIIVRGSYRGVGPASFA